MSGKPWILNERVESISSFVDLDGEVWRIKRRSGTAYKKDSPSKAILGFAIEVAFIEQRSSQLIPPPYRLCTEREQESTLE